MVEKAREGLSTAVGFLLLCVLGLAGCADPGSSLEARRYAPSASLLRSVAVVPFGAGAFPPSAQPRNVPADAGAIVARAFADGLNGRGFRVTPENDVRIAISSRKLSVEGLEASLAAEIVSTKFGATSVLIGQVTRFKDRSGGQRGSMSPASVAFTVSLHEAPSGRLLWRGKFDLRQPSLTEDPRHARRLPGGGRRWLTSTQLATWGVANIIDSMLAE